MKNTKNYIIYFLVFALMATVMACASTPRQEGTGEYFDDSVITTKVKSLLAADDLLGSFQIGVETYKGIVQLSGFVDSQRAVNRADHIARSVDGVTGVANSLVVK